MAKRSKKKNPNAPSNQQRENIRHNQALDIEIGKWNRNLNITLAVVIAVAVISCLLLPILDMNFSSSLSEFLGEYASDDKPASVEKSMSALDFLFAMTYGYSNSIEYIAKSGNNSLGIGGDFSDAVYNVFLTKVTQDDIDMLDNAYIFAFVLCILLFISIVALVTVTAVKRSKKQDGISLMVAIIIFSVLAILQWIFFVAVGIASAGKGQIQPHVGSYLLLASAITLCVVYGIFKSKVKNLGAQRKPVKEEK